MNGVLADWQRWRRQRSKYPGQGSFLGIVYCALGLGETGEAVGEVKKAWRDDNPAAAHYPKALTAGRREKLLYELGDVLWYLDAICDELGTSLEELALMNMNKINRRELEKRNVG